MRFLIIVAGWNCEPYVNGCLESIKAQTYKDYDVIIVDDCSTDGTYNEILKCINTSLWFVYRNEQNMGGFYNFDKWSRYSTNDTVLIPFALDDIMKPNALELIAKEYDKGAWMTYGTYINKDGFIYQDLDYPEHIHQTRDYRKDKFRCTGLRTYYKKLYERTQVPPMDEIERKQYYDLEYAFQLMEMCGKDRIGVIKEPIYEYNNKNPNSTANLNKFEREKYNEICKRPKKDLILQL